MSAQRDPDPIERMAIERQNALAADWGAREWFQLPTTEEREASVWAMLAAVRVLRDYLGVNSDFHAFRAIEEVSTEHERRVGGKGE